KGFWYVEVEDFAASMGVKRTAKPRFTIFPHYFDHLKAARKPISESMQESELEKLRKSAYRFGNESALLRFSLAAGLNGREKEALDAMRVLAHLHPQFYPPAYATWKRASASSQQRYEDLLAQMPAPSPSP